MENYSWKLKGLAHGVDPLIAAEELRRLQELHGTLTPEKIVESAKSRRSPLHKLFEWDDAKAAESHRLQQARTILNNIQVVVVTDGEPRKIDVYEVTTRSEGYKSIDTFTPDDIDYVRNTIKLNLEALRRKAQLYKEFDKVLYYIEQALAAV